MIEIKEKHKGDTRYKMILDVTAGRLIPAWLEVDQENLKGTVKALPTREEIDVPVDEMLIVELYFQIKMIHRSGSCRGPACFIRAWFLWAAASRHFVAQHVKKGPPGLF